MAIDWVYTSAAMQGWGAVAQSALGLGLLIVGVRGLNAFKRETRFKAQAELGAECIVAAHDMVDLINHMRNDTFVSEQELEAFPQGQGEPTGDFYQHRRFSIVRHRLTHSTGELQRLRRVRHQAIAVFSRPHADALEAVGQFATEVADAAETCHMRYRIWQNAAINYENQLVPESAVNEALRKLHESEDIATGRPDDATGKRLQALVNKVEDLFKRPD